MIILYLSFINPLAIRYLSFCDHILYLSILGFRLRLFGKNCPIKRLRTFSELCWYTKRTTAGLVCTHWTHSVHSYTHLLSESRPFWTQQRKIWQPMMQLFGSCNFSWTPCSWLLFCKTISAYSLNNLNPTLIPIAGKMPQRINKLLSLSLS